MSDFPNFKFEDAIPDLCPETQLNLRKFLQAAGIENMLIKDGRRISDSEVLNEIRKGVAMLSINGDERNTSLIPACVNGEEEAVKSLLISGECNVNEVGPDGETALTCAVSANAVKIVEMLLKHGADPNYRGKKVECSPLMEAASVGYTDIVKLLLLHGACVEQKSNTGNTALHYAATSGHLECVCLLLQHNSPMEVQNETGHTPLMEATSNGHIDVARCLIKHGCNINSHSTEFKESALTLASYKGHVEMVRFLLSAGADHEHRTDEMHTALMEAAMEGHVEVARLLLAHGANVNIPQDSFESPLTLAACGGHTELAHLLIGYGADIEEVNDEGYTPLMEAAREGHEETVALLLAVGADVNARTEETQETALTLAACGGFIEVCEMLLNAGANIEVGSGCSTPLMEAAQEGHLELVRRLLQRGASVNATTTTGDTALHYAAENGHVKVCEELLAWKAVYGAMTEGGRTPLMKAARTGHVEVVQLFLERGVPIDQPTSLNDANALSLACSGGHAKMVEFLLQHGADPQYQLRDGSTMLIEAARSGNPAVLRLILDYPKCLTQPSTILPSNTMQLVTNGSNQQHEHLHSIGSHEQRVSYQPLINGAPTVDNTVMPPPPPPLPISMTGVENVDINLDQNYGHVHPHSCHSHQHLSFQTPSLSTLASSPQPQSHMNAALVNAYAKGWVAGAAASVQHQHTLTSVISSSVDAPVGVCSPVNTILSHSPISGNLPDPLPSTNNLFDFTPRTQSTSTNSSSLISSNASQVAHNAHLNFQTTSVTAAVNPVTGMTSVHTVLTQGTLGTGGTTPVSSTINNVNNISEGSSTSSESSASSMVAGSSIDSTDDIGVGLLALLQKLMPGDKDELMRRFEAWMCPPNTLQDVRNAVTHHRQQNIECSSAAALAMSTNAAAIALSKLIDQQGHCRTQPTSIENGSDTMEQILSYCSHASAADILISKTGSSIGLSTTCDSHFSDSVPTYSDESAIVMTKTTIDQSEISELDNPSFGSTANTTPVMSSCHSSCSALSTSECSVPPVSASNSSCRLGKINSSLEATLPTFDPYEYGLDKIEELLRPTIDSTCINGLVGAVHPPTSQNVIHDPNLNHDMLACYRHYHHPGSHFSCAFDATAAVAGLGHPNAHTTIHHHHHHHHRPLAVSASGDNLVTPGGLLRLPQQTSSLSVDALINNPVGNIAYDPSAALTVHQHNHPNSLPVSGTRVLPMATQTILSANGNAVVNHGLTTDINAINNNLPGIDDSLTPVNVPSLIDVNACIESSMETALTLACSGGFVDLVRLLLERGADKEHRDKKSHTPLHTAVYANQRAVVALLLDYGADIEAQVDRTKDTALSIACSHGKLEIVEELLNRGANKEHRNISDYTPLSLAASGGFVEVIQLLLRHGAEINSRTGSKLGISPLMLASMNGHTAAVRLLLEHGSDINAHIETNRNTALTLACFQGRHEVVQLLVERKANIEHRAKTGLTPLMEAASGDYVEVGRILLDHGADVNASPVPSSRDTALTIAADKGNAKFVNLLLEKGAIVESRNKKGATPLWLASNGGHLEVVQSLIHYNASVNSQDNRKVSCLMAAFRKGHINVVRLLVQYVTQFPSDKDCIRHIKTAVTDKELAKRCQQCREIIIAAKEKQEGEARKNADCLLEQIEQEEEERANREAMQARKRERKRMKRKAKQEKERQVKNSNQKPSKAIESLEIHNNDDLTTSNQTVSYQDNVDASSTERSPTLSSALQHAEDPSLSNQINTGSETEVNGVNSPELHDSVSSTQESTKTEKSSTQPFSTINEYFMNDFTSYSDHTNGSETQPSQFTISEITRIEETKYDINTVTVTDAKREKHRNKKQSQRAAKRAAAEQFTSDIEKSTTLIDSETQDSHSNILSHCYPVSPNGDSDVNWNALIESQSTHLDSYLNAGKTSGTTSESNSWIVAFPSNNSRTQRSTAPVGRSGHDNADWKTNSNANSCKRRLSIPVSKHDIGKVIGQGGAVVSALRNMSGIQIDIESARSDEVTERMVYLKGPSDAVQRTYETIQGLLSGSIAGNDVLLMYAALKKSTTSPSNVFLGNSILGALNSRTNGASTVTVSSSSKPITSVNKPTVTNRTTRKTLKSSISLSSSTTVSRSTSAQPTPLPVLSKSSNKSVTASVVSSNSNNNSTTVCSTTVALVPTTGFSNTTVAKSVSSSANWNSKVSTSSSAKRNFASVVAAALNVHPSRSANKTNENHVKSGRTQTKTTVPNLMAATPILSSTTPVSLLSLNLSSFPTSSYMFPDLIPSLSNRDTAFDSLDDASFPPLNPPKEAKVSLSMASTGESEIKENGSTVPHVTSLTDSLGSTSLPESNQFDQETRKITAITETLSSLGVFDKSGPTTCTSTLNSLSHSITSSISPSMFGPLTVSPPIGAVHTSHPHTPLGSGGSYTATYVCTPTTTTIAQTKPFARAPGSERSAHQRNANVNIPTVPLSLADSFPPSLMSLDVNGTSTATAGGVVNDVLLLTPTKRAVSPEMHNSDFRQDSIQNHFRPEHPCEWQPSPSTSNIQPAFAKSSGFSITPNSAVNLPSSDDSSVNVGHSVVESMSGVVTNSTQVRPSVDSFHPVSTAWSMQNSDLNPSSLEFQPSFQPSTNTSSGNHKTSNNQPDPLAQTSVIRNEFSNISGSEQFSDHYALQSSQPNFLKQITPQTTMKPPALIARMPLMHSTQQQTQNGTTLSNMCVPNIASSTCAPVVLNAARSKPLVSVNSNIYLEPRAASLNGFSNSICAQPPSTLPLNAQFPSVFPPTHHQPYPPLPHQLPIGATQLQTLTQQQSAAMPSRINNTSHPLVNPAQFSMGCPTASANSYTPPPYIPAFVQPSVQGSSSNSSSGMHPGSTYTPHLINGVGPTSTHVGTVGAPPLGSGMPSATQPAGQNHSTSIQPIGAERRRQTGTLTSAAPSNLMYPSISSNNSLPGALGPTASAMGNQLPSVPIHTPPPQQCGVNSNANSLFMAFTMNWMQQQQQQQQQQQHSALTNGTTGSGNTPNSWSSIWPNNNMSNNFSSNCPPVKLPTGVPGDMATYNNPPMMPTPLAAVNGSAGQQQQQQQSLVAAAMAAMAGMYPWNTGAGSGMLNTIPATGVSTASSNRWVGPPHMSSTYSNLNPSNPQTFFQEQIPTALKTNGNTGSGVHPSSSHRSQAL